MEGWECRDGIVVQGWAGNVPGKAGRSGALLEVVVQEPGLHKQQQKPGRELSKEKERSGFYGTDICKEQIVHFAHSRAKLESGSDVATPQRHFPLNIM